MEFLFTMSDVAAPSKHLHIEGDSFQNLATLTTAVVEGTIRL